MRIKVVKYQPTKAQPDKPSKDKWSVMDDNDNWYNAWDKGVVAQLEDAKDKGYDIDVTTKEGKPPFNPSITGVMPPGVSQENFEQDILAEFKKDAPPAPKPKVELMPVNNELALLVDERKHAIYCASVYFAGRQAEFSKITAYADCVLKYLRNEDTLSTKVVQKPESKEKSDDLAVENFLR